MIYNITNQNFTKNLKADWNTNNSRSDINIAFTPQLKPQPDSNTNVNDRFSSYSRIESSKLDPFSNNNIKTDNYSKTIRITEDTKAIRNDDFDIYSGKFNNKLNNFTYTINNRNNSSLVYKSNNNFYSLANNQKQNTNIPLNAIGAYCYRVFKCGRYYVESCKETTYSIWLNDDQNNNAENFNINKTCEDIFCDIDIVPQCCDNSDCPECSECIDGVCLKSCEENECCINNQCSIDNCPCINDNDCNSGSKCCNGVCEIINSCPCSNDSDCFNGATCCYGTCCNEICCDNTETCGSKPCCTGDEDCDVSNCFECSQDLGRCITSCGPEQSCCNGECKDLLKSNDIPLTGIVPSNSCCDENEIDQSSVCGPCERCVEGWCVNECEYDIFQGSILSISPKSNCNNYCDNGICKNDCECNEVCARNQPFPSSSASCEPLEGEENTICCKDDSDCPAECMQCISGRCKSYLEEGQTCCNNTICMTSLCYECLEVDGVFDCVYKCSEFEVCCNGNCCSIFNKICCEGRCQSNEEPCCSNDDDCTNIFNGFCCDGKCIDHECCESGEIWSPCKNKCVFCDTGLFFPVGAESVWSEEKCRCECVTEQDCSEVKPNTLPDSETCECNCNPSNIEQICSDKNLTFFGTTCSCDCDSGSLTIREGQCPVGLWDSQTCSCKCNERFNECDSPYVFGPGCICICPEELESADPEGSAPGSPGARLPECPNVDNKKGLWSRFDCECIYPCSEGLVPYICSTSEGDYLGCADCESDEYLGNCGQEDDNGFALDAIRPCKKIRDSYDCVNTGFSAETCLDKHYIEIEAKFNEPNIPCPIVCRDETGIDCDCDDEYISPSNIHLIP